MVLELLASVKTLGVRKKITNITVPEQEKQISPSPSTSYSPGIFSKIYHVKGMCVSLPVDLPFREVCYSTSFNAERAKKFNCFEGMQNFSSCYRLLLNAHHIA